MAAGLMLLVAAWACGTRPAAELVIRPLENEYPVPSLAELQQKGIHQVVVLTGGGYPVTGELRTAGLPPASETRFVSGLELCSQLGPDCRLVLSGSAGRMNEDIATADVMAELARRLSPDLPVAGESRSRTTGDHPINVRPLVKNERFILVTSGYHMPRAMLAFSRAGYDAVPYPVDFQARGDYDWASLLPSPESLSVIQLALHEYVGLAWYNLSLHY